MIIKFLRVSENPRTMTFEVDGQEVTRKIPDQFEGSLDDYLRAHARGLAIEFAPKPAPIPIADVGIAAGTVMDLGTDPTGS